MTWPSVAGAIGYTVSRTTDPATAPRTLYLRVSARAWDVAHPEYPLAVSGR
ncbi:MAG: hypothetical protein AB7L66_09715 [Gemmatimonadales bacterium]